MQPNSKIDNLFKLIGPICEDSELELVEIEEANNAQGPVLRLFVDYLDSERGTIGIKECADVSRQVSALLDVEDPMPSKYSLEVSSPGVARPLRTPTHFKRFIGERAKITLGRPLNERRNFSGELIGLSDDETTLTIDVDGQQFQLALCDMASARLIPNWDAVMNPPRPKNGNQDKKQPKTKIQGNAVKA